MKKFPVRRFILIRGLFLVARNKTCKDPRNMANYVQELSEIFAWKRLTPWIGGDRLSHRFFPFSCIGGDF
jgi:hypothetical protein